MKKETTAKKLADAIERGDKYKDLMLHFNREATRCQSCLHLVAQERDKLRTKYTLALLDKEALGAKQSVYVWRLAEAASDLAQERLRHQATKRQRRAWQLACISLGGTAVIALISIISIVFAGAR